MILLFFLHCTLLICSHSVVHLQSNSFLVIIKTRRNLFKGKRQVKEKDLKDATPVSIYKISEKLHTQERDVAKFWQNCSVRIALYGFENQTEIDKKMKNKQKKNFIL